MHIKSLQEPDHQGCHKYNSKCSLQKIFRFVPEQMSDILCTRHTIVRKFHNKRNRLSTEECPAHQKCHQDSHQNPAKVQSNHYKCSMFREKCCRKKCIDWKLCRTAHKRSQQDRHLTVTFRRKCTACHNTRNSTTESDQHRNNTSSGKTDLSQQLVHYKCNTRHISAVFQQR